MYRVEIDGKALYDPRLKDYSIFTPKLKLEVNKSGAFDFKIYPNHPLYARIEKLKSIIEVFQDDTLLFRGRVLDDEMDFNKAKTVACEGELAYFNDSILRPYEFTGSVKDYLTLIINQHNSQVQADRRFTLGTVTVTDPNNLIVRSDKTYPVTWDVVESKLIKSLGGYMMVRRENGINYIDYLADSNRISLQKIELGKNLLDLATQSSANEVYTAILPLGKEIDGDTGERLTIKTVNNGKDYIQDDEAIAKYGFIMKVGDWKDVTIASNLLTKARQELAQAVKLSLSLELTAIDLSMINVDIGKFRVFDYVNVLSKPHGIDERLLVEKMEINLTAPDNNKITIGQQTKTLTDSQIQTDKAVGNVEVIKGDKGEKGDPGEPGKDGAAGKDGVGVLSTLIEYAISTSGTSNPSSGWSVNVPDLVKGQYLWTRTKWSYTDGTTETGYSVAYISKDGNNGTNGLAGKDGVGIKSTAITYVGSASGTVKPTTGWASTIPTVAEGQFLWTRTVWTYTDNTTETGYSVAKMGAKGAKGDKGDQGETGKDGVAGKDGVGVLSTLIEYAISTSGTSNPSSGWSVNVPDLVKGQYLWTRTKWSYTDGTTETGYSVAYISKDGNNGTNGLAGKDGVGIKSTAITYVGSASGTVKPTTGWASTIPTVAEGQFLWTRTVWTYTDNTTETGYSVAKMGAKGAKGDKGDQGETGKDGVAGKDGVGVLSTLIEYAISTSGTSNPSSGWSVNVPDLVKGQYLWTRTKWSYTDGTTETGYSVAYISKDGNNGTNGLAGKDGVGIKSTAITYVGSASGTVKPTTGWASTIPTVAEGQFLWTRTVWTYTDNTTETGYSVAKMGAKGAKGDKGEQGIQGPPGTNGTSQFLHIRYSANADGSAMTSTPQANTLYIGLANTPSATAPSTNASYTWSKYKGETGSQGIPGAPGKDGKPTYTWVRYADDDKGTGISDSPDGKLYIGLAFNKDTATESNVPSQYTWSLMPQNIDVGGRNYFIQRKAEDNKALRWMFGDAIEEVGSLLSGFIPISPSDNFLTSHKTNQRAFYNKDFDFLASSMHAIELEMKIPSYSEMTGTSWNLPEATPVDTEPAFMRIAFRDDFLSTYDRKTVYVQKGTKATDWMPAPEDIEAELNDKANNGYVEEIVTTLNTTIEETAELIRTEVNETYTEKSEFSTYQESVSTEFQQTKEAFDFTFKDLITQIETLDGETQAQFEEIIKYIRFVDGNIVLGQVGNDLELKIKHDRIQFLQNGVEVAFFSNNQFSVTDGEFINSLKLGNFAFMPRENGSLDFKKVVS